MLREPSVLFFMVEIKNYIVRGVVIIKCYQSSWALSGLLHSLHHIDTSASRQ